MADQAGVVELTERLCRGRTPNPGGDEHALAVLLAEELRARRADEVEVVEVPRAGSRGAYVFARFGTPRVYRACGHAAEP